MKGDYSQPGLMPGRYLEEIDLPSAYLVYAVVSGRSYNFRPAAHRFRILYPIGRSRAIAMRQQDNRCKNFILALFPLPFSLIDVIELR